MLVFDAVIPPKPPSIFCIYCKSKIYEGESGWGWFITGEKWHTECFQQFEQVSI